MTKDALPFTYVSRKKLADGTREYWRFRHPNLGERKLAGDPSLAANREEYLALLKEAKADPVSTRKRMRSKGATVGTQVFSHVYFIGCGSDGPVKIGQAYNPEERLATLQVANHEQLFLLAAMRGGCAIERTLHKHFAAARIRGEWFARTPELIGLIEDISAGLMAIETGTEEDRLFGFEC